MIILSIYKCSTKLRKTQRPPNLPVDPPNACHIPNQVLSRRISLTSHLIRPDQSLAHTSLVTFSSLISHLLMVHQSLVVHQSLIQASSATIFNFMWLIQGSHLNREKSIFPRTVGTNLEKGITRAKLGIFPRFFSGKTQVFSPGKTQPSVFSHGI